MSTCLADMRCPTEAWPKCDGTPLAENASQLEKKKAFFVRIIKTWDVSVQKQADFLVDMLQETIYENTLIVVKWTGNIKESSPVADLKRNINALENVYASE